MQGTQRNLTELYSKSDALFLELSAYFKKLIHDHHKADDLTVEEKKILKLFNYNSWEEYMSWVEEKLEESGELNEEDRTPLPEIIEEEADLEESISCEPNTLKMVKCEWLAIENAKLRKENYILQDKIEHLKRQHDSKAYSTKHST
jgi:CRISPR/Cas system CSM-associated protein Csm4 (group 5 of RAMP superfamily)